MTLASAGQSGAVALIGAGSIGIAFAVVFARAGFEVRVQDPDPARLALVKREVALRLDALADYGLIQEEKAVVVARIATVADLAAAVAGVRHVQECAPETLDLKRTLFAQLDRLAPDTATLASSSSALMTSTFAGDVARRHRCLVAHPGNPPYLLDVIEIVPAPFTSEETVARASTLFQEAGLTPVRLRKEVEGFVFNRLQGAVLREAYCLVRDGVASVEDIDRVVRNGLGRRWSVIGPFETAELNTRGGIASHAEKMGPAYARMGAERGQDDPWTPDLVARVERERRQVLAPADWEKRVAWRDRALMAVLATHRPIWPE